MSKLTVELNQYCFNRPNCEDCPFDFGGEDKYFCIMPEIIEKLNTEEINEIFKKGSEK